MKVLECAISWAVEARGKGGGRNSKGNGGGESKGGRHASAFRSRRTTRER